MLKIYILYFFCLSKLSYQKTHGKRVKKIQCKCMKTNGSLNFKAERKELHVASIPNTGTISSRLDRNIMHIIVSIEPFFKFSFYTRQSTMYG